MKQEQQQELKHTVLKFQTLNTNSGRLNKDPTGQQLLYYSLALVCGLFHKRLVDGAEGLVQQHSNSKYKALTNKGFWMR